MKSSEQKKEINTISIVDREIEIPRSKWKKFESLIGKIASVAKKGKFTPPEITLLDEYNVRRVLNPVYSMLEGEYVGTTVLVPVKKYRVSFQNLVALPGNYRLLGIVDHKNKMVRTFPGESVSLDLVKEKQKCDHCQSKRHRKETFIVESKDGDIKQLGRQCLVQYLGIDGNMMLKQMDEINTAVQDSRIDEDFIPKAKDFGYSLKDILSITNAFVDKYGYRGSTDSDPSKTTKHKVLQHLSAIKVGRLESDVEVTEADIEKAKNIIDQARKVMPEDAAKNKQNYLQNIKQLATSGIVPSKYMGFAVSMVNHYNRINNQEDKPKQKKITDSQHQGSPGLKIERKLRIISCREYDGKYGKTKLYHLEDDNGNHYTKWGFIHPEFIVQDNTTPDTEAAIKGSIVHAMWMVKRHEKYNGDKTTVLGRLSKVKELL